VFHGVLVLLERSLRVDARAWPTHLARAGLMLTIYMSVLQIQSTAFAFGAPGLRFFQSIVYLNLMFMTLLGLGFFSTAITEEKEEDTLGLMQMAGINSLGILLGKVGGRLLQALLLITVQYPFTLLSITLGGVANSQVRAAYVGLIAFLLGLAGWGLFCSTISRNNRAATRTMVIGLIAYWLVPYFAGEWRAKLAKSGMGGSDTLQEYLLDWISQSCVYLQTGVILTTGGVESPWSIQALTNPIGGALFLLLSWAVFDRCSQSPTAEPVSRGWLSRRRGQFRWLSPGRPQFNPFLWKDFHFAAGGVANLLVRLACYLGLLVVVSLLSMWWGTEQLIVQMYLGLLIPFLTFDASLLVSRSLHDEMRGQTLSALVMLPRPLAFVVYSKLAGAMLGILPGLTCFLFTLFGTHEGDQMVKSFMEGVSKDSTGQYLANKAAMNSYLLLLPHLAFAYAVIVRWGAVPLAIGSLYAVAILQEFLMAFLFYRGSAVSPNRIVIYMSMSAGLNILLCVACHLFVLWRFRKLAER
jgi:ABC-type transport system involved in multi-copper enzyme maturation permease subunit